MPTQITLDNERLLTGHEEIVSLDPLDGEAILLLAQHYARANEPGNKLYALHRTEDATVYVFLERYDDEAALAAHRAAPHFKELGRKLGEYMAKPPEVKRMAEVDL